MTDASLQKCLSHLADVFGAQYVVGRNDGLRRMANELRQTFELTRKQASDILAEMEQSGAIRYVESPERVIARDADVYRDPTKGPPPVLGQDVLTADPFHEPVETFVNPDGYWKLTD